MENAEALVRLPLGSFDNAQALTGEKAHYNLVAVAAVRGPVDPGRLRQVLALLTSRYPMLRARVIRNRRRHFEIIGDAPSVSLEVEQRQDPDTWKAIVERELEHHFELASRPLGRCILVSAPGEGEREIIFNLPHALVDGAAMRHLVLELLSDLGEGGSIGPERSPVAVPASADEHFPAAWRRPRRIVRSAGFLGRQLADEVAFRWRSRGRHAGPPTGPCHCRVLPLTLTPAETESLIRATRRRRVTMTAALEAAMLLAVVRHRYRGLSLPHRYFSFPLLRSYLDPPVSDQVVRCYVTLLRLTSEVSADDRFWWLASRINRQIGQALRRGERFLASIWSHFSMRMVFSQRTQRMATTALSYTGAVRMGERYGELALRELHAFVSNFPRGPEYTAQARLFRGRLWLDILYLDADMAEREARAIADTMRALLTGEAAAEGRRSEASG